MLQEQPISLLQGTQLEPIHPGHAVPLFELTERNRDYLRPWLPWLDAVQTVSGTERFIEDAMERGAAGRGLVYVISDRGAVAGVVAFNEIDRANRSGTLGYWLGEAFSGRGLVTRAAGRLTELGFDDLGLHRVAIHCALDNRRSRAVAERLGFTLEGTLRECEWLYDHYVDHAVYARLATDGERPTPV